MKHIPPVLRKAEKGYPDVHGLVAAGMVLLISTVR